MLWNFTRIMRKWFLRSQLKMNILRLRTAIWRPIFGQFLKTLKLLFSRKLLETEQNGENFRPLRVYCLQNYNFWKFRFWGHMTPQGHMTSETWIVHYFRNRKRYCEMERIWDPFRVTACKTTNFEVFRFAVFWLVNINLPLSQKP